MSQLVSSLLSTAELPIIKVQHWRQEKIHKQIKQLESALNMPAKVAAALESLLQKDNARVLAAFEARLEKLHTKRLMARDTYAEHERDGNIPLEELVVERLELMKRHEKLGRAGAAYELYVAATCRQP